MSTIVFYITKVLSFIMGYKNKNIESVLATKIGKFNNMSSGIPFKPIGFYFPIEYKFGKKHKYYHMYGIIKFSDNTTKLSRVVISDDCIKGAF